MVNSAIALTEVSPLVQDNIAGVAVVLPECAGLDLRFTGGALMDPMHKYKGYMPHDLL